MDITARGGWMARSPPLPVASPSIQVGDRVFIAKLLLLTNSLKYTIKTCTLLGLTHIQARAAVVQMRDNFQMTAMLSPPLAPKACSRRIES